MDGLKLLEHAQAGRGFSLARLRFSTAVEGDVYHVAVAGSDDLRDWVRNLSTELVEWPGPGPGLVHLGFWEAAEILHRWFWSRTRGRKVHIHGHSMGGSIAVLLALALHESGRDVVDVTTYGAPRVGDAEFRSHYPLPVTAYRCGRDPIPAIPRWGRRLLSNESRGDWVLYHHVATPLRLPTQLGWRSALPWRWHQDHSIQSYRQALEAHHERNTSNLSR